MAHSRYMWVLSVTQSCLTLCGPMEFSRQEYWSGLPFPSPGDLPDPGIKPASLTSLVLAGGFFTTSAIGKAQNPNNDLSTYWFI